MVGGPVCGVPVRFYKLKRERTDYAPVCCRPYGHPGRHLSRAAVEHAKEHWRENRHRYRPPKMSAPGDRTEPC